MREILFRGKTAKQNYGVTTEKPIKENMWVYGNLTVGKIDGYHIDMISNKKEIYTIKSETIGQFTGLTDKNGKKIFEGDIVKREFTLQHGETKKTRETQIGVVVYSNRECRFEIEKKCNLRKPWDGDTIEVIGNIHDNKELLGEQQ